MRKALYFLGILNDSDLDWLIAASTRRQVDAGMHLIDEGRPTDSVFVVIDGAFGVESAALGGRQIARIMSGEVLGEMSFVDTAPASATVKALERSSVLAISRKRLTAKLAEDSGFASRFYRALSMFLADRLRNTMTSMGTGLRPADEGELQDDTMDNIALAGARFDWIQQRLRSA
jgi:CRP/FNR family transcriptional regulator, cyclic AMP receptor protein